MDAAREQMLQRIREAVREGNRADGRLALIPERGRIGYQGAGADPLECFRIALTAAGGQLHVVEDRAAAVAAVLDLVRSHSVRRVLLGRGGVLDALPILEPLRAGGVEIVDVLAGGGARTEWFAADLGLSGVDYLLAETGSIVLASHPDQPRSLSLLPPIHIAVAERRQLLPDLFDLFSALGTNGENLPAGLTIITGPSKTGDIELRLVTGVHGPGEVHVILIAGESGQRSQQE